MFYFVLFITCGQVELNTEFLNPYYIKALQRTKEKALIDFEDVPLANRQLTTARPRSDSLSSHNGGGGSPRANPITDGSDDEDDDDQEVKPGGFLGKRSKSNENGKKKSVGDSSVSKGSPKSGPKKNPTNSEEKKSTKNNTEQKVVTMSEPKSKAPQQQLLQQPQQDPKLAGSKSPVPEILNDIGQSLGNIFDTIEKQGSQTQKQFCKYCYTKMMTHKGGDIDDYFARFENGGYGLDFEDRSRIKRLFRYCSLCPQCFRPFALYAPKGGRGEPDVDRYTRHTVLQEIASCYVFLLLVWIPLLITFLLPALFSLFFKRISKLSDTSHTNRTSASASFGDYHRGSYHETIKNVIESVKNEHDFDEGNFGQTADSKDSQIIKLINQLSTKVENIQVTQQLAQSGKDGSPFGYSNIPTSLKQKKALVMKGLHNRTGSKKRLKKHKSKKRLGKVLDNEHENSFGDDSYDNNGLIGHKNSIPEDTETDPQTQAANDAILMAGVIGLKKAKAQNSKGNVLKVQFNDNIQDRK